MVQLFFPALLWISAIGGGIIAGIFFAFSTFIMPAFARIPAPQGIAAMQSINATILRSPFMAVFFATTLSSALLAGMALFNWDQPWAAIAFAAGLIYFAGMFLCTAIFNVPLNNALAAVTAEAPEAAHSWARYLERWTGWNHLRTAASLIACGLFIAAIAK